MSQTSIVAHEAADERLDAVLGHLRSTDASVQGAVGDDSPLDALADRVRSFSPDHGGRSA